MDKKKEELELLGWLIVKGAPMHVFKTVLGENLQFCKLSIMAVNTLPNEEFAQGKKKPYTELILNYTNHRESDKRHQKEDLVLQNFDIDICMIWLLNKGFFAKWIFTYFRGFSKIIYALQQRYPGEIKLSDASSLILDSFLQIPTLNEAFLEALTKPVEESKQKNANKVTRVLLSAQELAEKITEGNGTRSKIVAALKEDYWIHKGRYLESFEISRNAYLISDSDFEFLFEVNQIILKKVFQKKVVLSDLSKELILLCSRLSEDQQLDMVESLEDACHARLNVCIDSGKTKIRLLANLTQYKSVISVIRSKFPSMEIPFK